MINFNLSLQSEGYSAGVCQGPHVSDLFGERRDTIY